MCKLVSDIQTRHCLKRIQYISEWLLILLKKRMYSIEQANIVPMVNSTYMQYTSVLWIACGFSNVFSIWSHFAIRQKSDFDKNERNTVNKIVNDTNVYKSFISLWYNICPSS